jgi:N-acyl-L-homoserine lactone synthetase
MIQLIDPDHYGDFVEDLADMHRLRYRIFKERLGWDVQVSGGMEVDEFDACRPVYLLQKDDEARVQGCVRLLPTTGPTMLRDTFSVLLDGRAVPASDVIWESSRFGVDLCATRSPATGNVAKATYELFAGMIEFGLMRQLRAAPGIPSRLNRIIELRQCSLDLLQEGSLRVGIFSAIAKGFLRQLVRGFVADHPSVAIDFWEDAPRSHIARVVAGEGLVDRLDAVGDVLCLLDEVLDLVEQAGDRLQ